MSFTFVQVDPQDHALLSQVGDITKRAYVDGGHLAVDDDYATHLADAAGRARDGELWAAVEDRTVLGSVAFGPPGSPLAEVAGPDEAEFRMLSVDAAARGRGVGSALVRQCIARARAHHLRAIVLSTQPTMRDAHRIYERLGFARTPERDWKPVPSVTLKTYRLDL
ncbi:GNAT family N-acetyltransferase [Luteipulveratus halotolerans]|uniref:Acetyltransferase n=1 Tax=Luteipulveratus halotolerans TaxID=1631356 RepID=A0A0L6CNQ5_9MICO|nr:GNAT family N-acetyltransferase [Luteipulveratus halotolerans]KNX39389.1 acetyltransferase [Luteipulveratus halotolerans]